MPEEEEEWKEEKEEGAAGMLPQWEKKGGMMWGCDRRGRGCRGVQQWEVP